MEVFNLTIERVKQYTPEIAAGIGLLQPTLNKDRSERPIPEDELRRKIESPTTEQIIAIGNGRIIGAATLSLINAESEQPTGWLDDFVVHPDAQGKGVSDKIADEWEAWFGERNVKSLFFTSNWQRTAAHKFYLRRGAQIVSPSSVGSAIFLYPIPA